MDDARPAFLSSNWWAIVGRSCRGWQGRYAPFLLCTKSIVRVTAVKFLSSDVAVCIQTIVPSSLNLDEYFLVVLKLTPNP